MFLWWGTRRRVKPVQDGRKERMRCPECGETATFRECELEEKVSVFSVVDVWEDRERLFRCGECGELFALEERPDPSAIERERQERRADADERRRGRAADEGKRAASVEAELAALKRKLGR
jgi:transcription elongation factor Elf1